MVKDVVRGFEEHDLMTKASAIAFQVLTTLIPLVMCVMALLGVLHLLEAWTQHLAPQVRHNVSPQTFKVIDSFVKTASEDKRGFWLLGGVPLVVWEASGAVRAVMGALGRIYGTDEERSKTRKYLTSFALGAACVVLFLAASAVFRFTPVITDGIVFSILRWPVALVLLITVVWLLMHYAPAEPIPARWASFGSVCCAALWVTTSAAFGFYVTNVVDYTSIFSTLALAFVTFIYLYLSAVVFLVGAQVDAIVRRERTGSWSGLVSGGPRETREGAATPRPAR
jgi:membrane protein